MKDYSKGTGDKAVTVCANISPKEAKFILSRLTAGFSEYTFQQDKIFGDKDEQGYAKVSKVRIILHKKGNAAAGIPFLNMVVWLLFFCTMPRFQGDHHPKRIHAVADRKGPYPGAGAIFLQSSCMMVSVKMSASSRAHIRSSSVTVR